jgi:hypothetical protein
MSRTVVTLSSRAEEPAVITTSRTITRNAEPLTRLAAQIAVYSNTPVWRSTPTMTIEQQENDVPVDAGLMGVEHVLGSGDTRGYDHRSAAQGRFDLVDPLGGDQQITDDEDRQSHDSHLTASAGFRSSRKSDPHAPNPTAITPTHALLDGPLIGFGPVRQSDRQ